MEAQTEMKPTETRWLVDTAGKPTGAMGAVFNPVETNEKGQKVKDSTIELSFKDLVCGSLLSLTYSLWQKETWVNPISTYQLYKKILKAEQPVWISAREADTIHHLVFARHGLEVAGAVVDYINAGEKKEFPLE